MVEEFDQLSDEDRMSLHIGESIEGEITGGSPDASIGSQPKKVRQTKHRQPQRKPPVVVAKDGKHTIPFEELQRARRGQNTGRPKPREASRIAQQSQSEQPQPDGRRRSEATSPRGFAKRCCWMTTPGSMSLRRRLTRDRP